MTNLSISSPITLSSGLTLKNRLVKAAMTEGLANEKGQATSGHVNLYNTWSQSGVGLLITGNVMVDRTHFERAGNVVIDGPQSGENMKALRGFAAAASHHDTKVIVQLSHSGRQCPNNINKHPKSASNVRLNIPGGLYNKPSALTETEIESLIGHFSLAAKACEEAGFHGVQVHGAHGYLISQFLSPIANKRTDRWGGSLENRARFLTEVISEIKDVVDENFSVSLKLNSADFQKGGFSLEDSKQVVRWLNRLDLDFLEVSGGTYEQPRMMGADGILEPLEIETVHESTVAREAFFMDYAAAIGTVAQMPLMVTGGFRTKAAMDAAIDQEGIDLIGIARPMVDDPICPQSLLDGSSPLLPSPEHKIRIGNGWFSPQSSSRFIQTLNVFGAQGWYYSQLLRLGFNKPLIKGYRCFSLFIAHTIRDGRLAKKIRKNLLKG